MDMWIRNPPHDIERKRMRLESQQAGRSAAPWTEMYIERIRGRYWDSVSLYPLNSILPPLLKQRETEMGHLVAQSRSDSFFWMVFVATTIVSSCWFSSFRDRNPATVKLLDKSPFILPSLKMLGVGVWYGLWKLTETPFVLATADSVRKGRRRVVPTAGSPFAKYYQGAEALVGVRSFREFYKTIPSSLR